MIPSISGKFKTWVTVKSGWASILISYAILLGPLPTRQTVLALVNISFLMKWGPFVLYREVTSLCPIDSSLGQCNTGCPRQGFWQKLTNCLFLFFECNFLMSLMRVSKLPFRSGIPMPYAEWVALSCQAVSQTHSRTMYNLNLVTHASCKMNHWCEVLWCSVWGLCGNCFVIMIPCMWPQTSCYKMRG